MQELQEEPTAADNASGICRTCRVAPARARAAGGIAVPVRSAARTVRARNGFQGRDLIGMSVDDLVGTIAGCREELGRRKEELAGQQAAIEQALGSG